jgi:hypothetical protein
MRLFAVESAFSTGEKERKKKRKSRERAREREMPTDARGAHPCPLAGAQLININAASRFG